MQTSVTTHTAYNKQVDSVEKAFVNHETGKVEIHQHGGLLKPEYYIGQLITNVTSATLCQAPKETLDKIAAGAVYLGLAVYAETVKQLAENGIIPHNPKGVNNNGS